MRSHNCKVETNQYRRGIEWAPDGITVLTTWGCRRCDSTWTTVFDPMQAEADRLAKMRKQIEEKDDMVITNDWHDMAITNDWQIRTADATGTGKPVFAFWNRGTGEIRWYTSFNSFVEAYDERLELLGRIAEALGPEIHKRWEDGDESLNLVAKIKELIGLVTGESD